MFPLGNQTANSSDVQCYKQLSKLPFCYAARQCKCLAVRFRETLNIMIIYCFLLMLFPGMDRFFGIYMAYII